MSRHKGKASALSCYEAASAIIAVVDLQRACFDLDTSTRSVFEPPDADGARIRFDQTSRIREVATQAASRSQLERSARPVVDVDGVLVLFGDLPRHQPRVRYRRTPHSLPVGGSNQLRSGPDAYAQTRVVDPILQRVERATCPIQAISYRQRPGGATNNALQRAAGQVDARDI